MRTRRLNFKTLSAVVWLLTTLSMATWWMLFTLKLLGQPNLSLGQIAEHRTMLYWEGASWVILLLCGGGFLIYFIRREDRRFSDYVRFISAYNHDAKTTLMNIMLQTERLEDQNIDAKQKLSIDRLKRSVLRLRTQIENSLYLSNQRDIPIISEKLSLKAFVEELALEYSPLSIELNSRTEKDVVVEADRKALESIFRNLIENAIQHGQATKISIDVLPTGRNQFLTSISDDGGGFKGDRSHLGLPFRKAQSSSGSGLGLYLVKFLTRKMNGDVAFALNEDNRLVIELSLRGQLA